MVSPTSPPAVTPSPLIDTQTHGIASPSDLAGPLWPQPNLWHTRSRINTLVDRYLSVAALSDRLNDLPHQLAHPTVRPWPSLEWNAIHPSQIIGLSPETFQHILLGIINTELPIQGYSQTSRQYLTPVHPGLAYFVGGQINAAGKRTEKGLWQREEQRHGPALMRVYRLLSGHQPPINPHQPRAYCPTTTPHDDLYRHGMHRVATEYSATCLYIWLMAHTTGPLQQVFLELVKDEMNHMVKFWGFGVWLFPQKNWGAMVWQVIGRQLLSLVPKLGRSPLPVHPLPHPTSIPPSSPAPTFQAEAVDMGFMPRMLHTLRRMRQELAWHQWSWHHRWEFFYTFIRIMQRLQTWHHTLTPTYLAQLLGNPPVDATIKH